MARKSKSRTHSTRRSADPSQAVRQSAQKIWLAGLGAFERAKAEGPKMFELLVKQGREYTGRARDAADQALRNVREQASDAGGKWDKLEQVFEERVSRSLGKLGVLTANDIEDLSKQVRELNESVLNLMRGAGKPAARKRGGAKKAATRTKKKARGAATRAKRARRA
ncbi:MAG: phasin family protein [Usitatibacter sp.]